MKTHPLNHRHIGGEKRDMWWLLISASFINKSMKNSPSKPQTQRERNEICDAWILTASYIKKFYSPAKTTDVMRREKRCACGGLLIQPHT